MMVDDNYMILTKYSLSTTTQKDLLQKPFRSSSGVSITALILYLATHQPLFFPSTFPSAKNFIREQALYSVSKLLLI